MLYLGPVIFGFIIGLILGTRINTTIKDAIKIPLSAFIVIFIAILIFAWQLGPFPYYDDLSISTGVVSAAIGLFIGSFLLNNKLGKNN